MKPITDHAFAEFGRVLCGLDTDEICAYMQKYENKTGVTYLASDSEMEHMAISGYFTEEAFGEMPLQIGACFGANRRMDAMEYHNCSEVNVAATDLILFLGRRQEVAADGTYDTAKAEQFFVPAGTVFEMYATTLHYAPCGVDGAQFRAVIVLPRGTNTELEKTHEDKLLVAKNKWLIYHPDAGLPEGTWLSLRGEKPLRIKEILMKTILVLGGAGYIGSHTVYELIDNGYDVVVADNLETGFRKAVHPKARFYQGDIRNKEFCDHVFSSEKIDAVIHFAANSQVGESMVNPLKYYDNNLGGTRTMLQSMIEHGVKYIVFSSTAATYGEPERVPILETDPTHPTNCYGETKLSMERMFYWASVAHGIHFVALRYFNACGAHMSGKIGEAHNPETHLIPIVLQVPNGQRDHVSIFGDDYPTRDGTCVRDYIHVTDLASAHILAAEYLMNGGENNVFNLGNGVGFTVKEIIDTAEKVVGKPIKCEMAARRAGDPAQLVASSEKAKTVLGWKPKYDDIETIIGSAWNWHKEHPHGYED